MAEAAGGEMDPDMLLTMEALALAPIKPVAEESIVAISTYRAGGLVINPNALALRAATAAASSAAPLGAGR